MAVETKNENGRNVSTKSQRVGHFIIGNYERVEQMMKRDGTPVPNGSLLVISGTEGAERKYSFFRESDYETTPFARMLEAGQFQTGERVWVRFKSSVGPENAEGRRYTRDELLAIYREEEQ